MEAASAGCSTFTNWVWGYDCLSCLSSMPGQGFPHTSCTYNWTTTSCTRSTCQGGGGFEEIEIILQ